MAFCGGNVVFQNPGPTIGIFVVRASQDDNRGTTGSRAAATYSPLVHPQMNGEARHKCEPLHHRVYPFGFNISSCQRHIDSCLCGFPVAQEARMFCGGRCVYRRETFKGFAHDCAKVVVSYVIKSILIWILAQQTSEHLGCATSFSWWLYDPGHPAAHPHSRATAGRGISLLWRSRIRKAGCLFQSY